MARSKVARGTRRRSGSRLATLTGAQIASRRKYVRVCDCCGFVFSEKVDCPKCGLNLISIFDSEGEFARWNTLLLLKKTDNITNLRRQVRYALKVNTATIGHYVADFEYFDVNQKKLVVEDYKGALTDLFNWKRKHFEAQYGMTIRVSTSQG